MDTGGDDMDEDDDKMSLSSLSSGEDTKIFVNVPIPQKKPQSPRANSMPYSMPPTSWNSNLNQSSSNIVNAWAAQMMPQTSTSNSQLHLQSQPSTSGYKPNPMFPCGAPPSLPGMPQSAANFPSGSMEAFLASMPPPSTTAKTNSRPTMEELMHMMSMGYRPPPPMGPDGLPDLKAMERLPNIPANWNQQNAQALPTNTTPGLPNANLPWASMTYMPQFQQSVYPSQERPQRDPEKELVNEVMKTVMQEMKVIMKKDLNRKMVESKAFKSLETWWDTCQLIAKAKVRIIYFCARTVSGIKD